MSHSALYGYKYLLYILIFTFINRNFQKLLNFLVQRMGDQILHGLFSPFHLQGSLYEMADISGKTFHYSVKFLKNNIVVI
ncbi:hypothetical protein AF331_20015 [Rossellomorea marisflavi]|uniref:Uncharacterized protein n=1 Tax=Rossellomorea marisflavi TaxID=189381 RepID=A0A0M0FZY9_9BACI|nr:hypothetical protein AF331_20015 [Rossellomorea marisflavi]